MNDVILVSGFLGVGKTTLIKQLIEYLPKDQKLAIIENDFGAINIDKQILGEYNLKITEINSGCICCSLVGDFSKAIVELRDKYNVDIVIIEPSGVANTSTIVNMIYNLDQVCSLNSINIIDVNKHKLYVTNFYQFYKNQIVSANTIVINKTKGLLDGEISSVVDDIRKINSEANIIIEKINSSILQGRIEDIGTEHTEITDVDNIFRNYSSISILVPKEYKKVDLENRLQQVICDRGIVRIKGLINIEGRMYLVDYVDNENYKLSYRVITNYYGSGKMTFIGEGINKTKILDIFGR